MTLENQRYKLLQKFYIFLSEGSTAPCILYIEPTVTPKIVNVLYFGLIGDTQLGRTEFVIQHKRKRTQNVIKRTQNIQSASKHVRS